MVRSSGMKSGLNSSSSIAIKRFYSSGVDLSARHNDLGCHSFTSSGVTALLNRLGGSTCRLGVDSVVPIL